MGIIKQAKFSTSVQIVASGLATAVNLGSKVEQVAKNLADTKIACSTSARVRRLLLSELISKGHSQAVAKFGDDRLSIGYNALIKESTQCYNSNRDLLSKHFDSPRRPVGATFGRYSTATPSSVIHQQPSSTIPVEISIETPTITTSRPRR